MRRAPLVLAAALAFSCLDADAGDLFTQLGAAVDSGRLESVTRLREGSVPLTAGDVVSVKGSPSARLEVVVRDRRLELCRYTAPDESLLLVGKGLHPDVVLTRIEADASGAVTAADFHGRGLGRVFVGLSKSSILRRVRQVRFNTDLSRLLRGDVLMTGGSPPPRGEGAPEATAAPPSGEAPSTVPAAAPAVPSFVDLVDEVKLLEFRLTARPGQPLSFGDGLDVTTGGGGDRDPLEVRVDEAAYQPGRGGADATWSVKGRLEGTLGAGSVTLEKGRISFRSAELLGGRFSAEKKAGAPPRTHFRAGGFRMDLARSALKLPGGIDVTVDEGSRFGVTGLVLEPDGSWIGRLDFTLLGGTGEIRHDGGRLPLSNATISSGGLLVRDGRATGPLSVDFDERLVHPFVVKQPGGLVPPKSVPLEFRGPFSARLLMSDAGAGTGGSLTGEYSLKIPWKPVERAAIEAMKAHWTQDVRAVGNVDFTLEPRAFGPCGPQCFAAAFAVTAEKWSGGKSLFRQHCGPEGRANLVVDPAARSVVLKDLSVRPRCKGAPGWFVGGIVPLLTTTCDGLTLFQLPPDLPFSVETVRSGADFVRIDGEVAWKGAPAAGLPQPPLR